MRIIKKNQLTILVLALMLVTAGYLNYNSNVENSTEVAAIGDATLVSSNLSNSITNQVENQTNLIENNANNNTSEIASSISTTEESTETNSEATSIEEYFTSSRLERDTMYSQMLESYQKILDSKTTSDKQKEAAQKEINSINSKKNSIMISENLIKTKGFENCIVFVNGESVSVIIGVSEIKQEEVAQIQNIVSRELKSSIENIHISTK